MRHLFALAILLLAPLAPAQPLVLGPEFAASDARLVPAFGTQSAPAMATDGSDFFVVWHDANGGGTIRGMRAGDETSILLSQTTGGSGPQVLWTESEYVVSWKTAAGGMAITRVRPDGTVVERERVVTTPAYAVSLATNGRNLLAAWLALDGSQLHVQLLTLAGDAAGNETILPWVTTIRAAGSASGFLLLGLDFRYNVTARRVSESGTPVGTTLSLGTAMTTTSIADVSIASDGESFVTGWASWPTGSDLLLFRIAPGGVTMQQVRFETPTTPRIAWNGNAYELLWSAQIRKTIRHALAGRELNVTAIEDVPSLDKLPAAMAATPAQTLLTMMRDGDLYSRPLGDGREILLTRSLLPQQGVAGAWNGSELLLAWLTPNEDGQGARVFAGRMTADGHRLDGEGIQLSEFASPQTGAPAVATDGDAFLVTWVQADGKLATQRIGADGSLREQALIDNGQGCRFTTPALAFDGSQYVLAYSTCRVGIYAGAAGTWPISRTGIPIGSEPRILSVVAGADPKIVWTGNHHFVTWLDSFGEIAASPPPNVVGGIVSPDNVLEHAFFIATSDPPKSHVALATNGDTVLVAWQEPGPRVFYKTVSAAGDPLTADQSISPATHPSAAWDGVSYILAYEAGPDIAVTRLGAEGPAVIPSATSPSAIPAGRMTAIAYTRDGRAYVRFAGIPGKPRAVR